MSDRENKIQSMGGKARAAALTADERSASSKAAADRRWLKASHEGVLRLGEAEIACYVLSDGRRVLSQSGLSLGLKMSKGGDRSAPGDRIANLLATKSLSPHVSDSLAAITKSPILFRTPNGGTAANGYEATVLADICDVVLKARREGSLHSSQKRLAVQCEVLQGAFARIGIIALVDEATGYQYDRAKDELQKILKGYISEELLPWVRRFNNEFFKQAYRIHGWEFREGGNKHPQYMGKFINAVIYEQLPAPVLPALRELNPPTEKGHRRHKHFQLLTEDTGIPHLDRQIIEATTLMKVSRDKRQFTELFERAFPRKGKTIPMDLG